ncbi:MAG: winged helix-turn-helix domain-containing protein [Blastocatellales bacterium]
MEVQAIEDFKRDKVGKVYEFGPYVADVAKAVLMRNGEIVPVGLKAFEVLLSLIEHRGEVVRKDELLSEVWPNTVVEENNLARTISALRKALDDHLDAPQYIATIPGRGYRFVSPVREIAKSGGGVRGIHDLNGVLGEPGAGESVQGREVETLARRLRNYKLMTAVVVVAIIVGTAVLMMIQQMRQPEGASVPRKLWQLTFDTGLEIEPTWSPDGRLIAYSSDRSGNFDIWVQPVGEGNAIQVTTSPSHDWQSDWSPEGNRLVFRSERDGGGLYVVPVLGGSEHKIASSGYYPRWSPDGTQVLFYSSILRTNTAEIPRLYIVGLDGKPPREVLTDFLKEFRSFRVAWHPDGRRLSIWGHHLQDGNGFWTIQLADGKPVKSEISSSVLQQLKDSGIWFVGFQWAPEGDALYFEGITASVKSLWKVTVDAGTLRWVDGPERLTAGAGLDSDVVISRNGRNLAFTSRIEQTRIWSFPFNATDGKIRDDGKPLTSAGMDAYFPDLTADGQRLAYVTNRAGKHELRVRLIADGSETVLIKDDLSRSSPRWSRDGKWLAYSRENKANSVGAQNRWDIAFISVDGGEEQALTAPGPLVYPTWDWTADGRWILAGVLRTTRETRFIGMAPVSLAPHAESQIRVLTSHPEENLYQARLSPDARWISFCAARRNQAGISTIYVIPAGGGQWVRMTEGRYFDDKPRWSPDGKTVYFISNRTGFFNVWGVRFDPATGISAGEPFRITNFDSPGQVIQEDVRTMELALTTNRMILPVTEQTGNIWILENVGR